MIDERKDFSRGATNNVIVTVVRMRGEKLTRMVNVYNQKDTESGERPARKLNWQCITRNGANVLIGDFNMHSR